MTLRKKTLLIIGVTLLSLMVVLYTTSTTILLGGFAWLEEQDTRQHVRRVLDAYTNELVKVSLINSDWAELDDSYAFIEDGNYTYIKSNLNYKTLARGNIDLIAVVNADRRLVFGTLLDAKRRQSLSISESFQKYLAGNDFLFQADGSHKGRMGIVLLPKDTLMITASQIRINEGTSQSRGTLIMGRYLNIEQLAERTDFTLTVHRFDESQMPPDFQAARKALMKEKSSFVQPLNEDIIAGYTLLKDIDGKPALLLRVDIPRVIYQQGQGSMRYLVWSLLAVGLVFSILTLLLLEKLVLYRLARLSIGLSRIGTSGDMTARVFIPGKDELSRLASAINWMLNQLEHSQKALLRANLAEAVNKELTREINKRKQIEQALFQEKELAQVTLQSIGDAVITTDASGYIKSLNPVAAKLTGWQTKEAQGLPLSRVFRIINQITREPVENPVEKALSENHIVKAAYHTVLMARDGSELAIDHSVAPIHASDRSLIGTVLVFRDVTQSRRFTSHLAWQASHDSLTKLFNRREFEQLVQQAVDSAKTSDQQHSLCYLDLDQFKIINDTCGHMAGDELLRQVSALFQTRLRKSDILARLGGDEFGVLLYQCPLEKAVQIANMLRERIQEFRFGWQDKTFSIGVSIGLVAIDAETQNLASALSAADAACYAAKNKGRNRVHVYQLDDRELAQQRGEMQWLSLIPKALEENRFRLYYQRIVPIAQTSTKREYWEVLLRLEDETGLIVSPMAFIPAAERYHLMHLIDRWVISTLFAYLKQQYQAQNCPAMYAINLSVASINDDQFINFVQQQFALCCIPPSIICFEITETLAITNFDKAAQFIRQLKALGCHFALDDFGSGMSSFAYLKNLLVDYLKIDGVFIKDILKDAIASEMVEAIARIASVMGIQTIAEFVDNDATLMKLKALGVDYVQGYSIAKPCPLNKAVS